MTPDSGAAGRPFTPQDRAAWIMVARLAARRIWRRGRAPVTVDDVRRVCPPPAGADPRIMGAVFSRTEWERVTTLPSERSTCHHRPIGAFEPRL